MASLRISAAPQQAVSYAHLVAHSTQQFEVLREVGLRPVGVARREADHAEGGEGDDGALDISERLVGGGGFTGVGQCSLVVVNVQRRQR